MDVLLFALVWLVHSSVLGGLALVLPRVFGVSTPRWLAGWWGSAAGTVVLLPVVVAWLMPRRSGAGAGQVATAISSIVAVVPAGPSSSAGISWWALAAGVWAVGLCARLVWLAVGHRRLRVLVDDAAEVLDDPALDEARALTADQGPLRGDVSVFEADDVTPCTFGGRSLRIVVPCTLRERSYDERRAVYLHELLHARRGDVHRAHGDEVWRAIWWWQPAVWWLLDRVRFARELDVDRAVVRLTGRPRAYVEALLWCTDLRAARTVALQAGARPHELVRRVSLMGKGEGMTRVRGVMTTVGMCVVMGGAVAVVGAAQPLPLAAATTQLRTSGAGPLERMAVMPTLDSPAPRRVRSVEPNWDNRPPFRFRVHLVLDASGHVAEARSLGAVIWTRVGTDDAAVKAEAESAVLDAVRQWEFEAPPTAPMLLVTDVTAGDLAWRAPGVQAALGSDPIPIRAGGAVAPPKKVHDVKPIYPQAAKDQQIQGVVILDSTIGVDGSVTDVVIVKSVPGLDDAAADAVRQWRFTPTLVNGSPVPVIVTMTVSFTLK